MNKLKAVSESDNENVADLIELIGLENTMKLIKRFGGSFLYIPLMRTLLKEERDTEIYNAYKSGVPYRNIGVKYSLAVTTVREIVSKKRSEESGRTESNC